MFLNCAFSSVLSGVSVRKNVIHVGIEVLRHYILRAETCQVMSPGFVQVSTPPPWLWAASQNAQLCLLSKDSTKYLYLGPSQLAFPGRHFTHAGLIFPLSDKAPEVITFKGGRIDLGAHFGGPHFGVVVAGAFWGGGLSTSWWPQSQEEVRIPVTPSKSHTRSDLTSIHPLQPPPEGAMG